MPVRSAIPAPVPSPETQPFWDAARAGRLLVKRCTSCGSAHWYPRTICPFCQSDATVWEESGGGGVIYSFSIMRRVAEPYAIAYVTLDEGITLLTNIVGCDPGDVAIGLRVGVTFVPTSGEGPPVPMFAPAAARSGPK